MKLVRVRYWPQIFEKGFLMLSYPTELLRSRLDISLSYDQRGGPVSNCQQFCSWSSSKKWKWIKSGIWRIHNHVIDKVFKIRITWIHVSITFEDKFGWQCVTWLIPKWTKNWTPTEFIVALGWTFLSYDLNRFFIKSKIFLSSTWNSSTLEVHLELILEHFLYNCNLINWVNKLQS